MAKWQVQEAKAKFSELMDRAEHDGPQIVTRHGEERAVLISIEDYRKNYHEKPDFVTFLLECGPKIDEPLFEREDDYGRDFDFGDPDE